MPIAIWEPTDQNQESPSFKWGRKSNEKPDAILKKLDQKAAKKAKQQLQTKTKTKPKPTDLTE